MNPFRVKTRAEVELALEMRGFKRTRHRVETGHIWESPTGKHLVVPDPVDDMYPDFILQDLEARARVLCYNPLA